MTCPPSVCKGIQRSPDHTRPDTPKPVPGPIRAMGAPATAAPPPTARRSSGLQQRQRQRQRGEVVQDQQLFQAQFLPRSLRRKRPGAVGELDPVAGDRRGNRDSGPSRARSAGRLQIRRGGGGQAGKIGAGQDVLGVNAADDGRRPEQNGRWCRRYRRPDREVQSGFCIALVPGGRGSKDSMIAI